MKRYRIREGSPLELLCLIAAIIVPYLLSFPAILYLLTL